MTPWNLKPLFGMLSDSLILFGYHRIPYIVIAGLIGSVSLFCLSVINFSSIVLLAVMFIFFVNISTASPDVMIDGVVAERSKLHPKYATDLQSLCFGSQSLLSIFGFILSGLAIRYYGPQAVFGALVFGSLLLVFPAAMNWLGEEKDTKIYERYSCCLNNVINVSLVRFQEKCTDYASQYTVLFFIEMRSVLTSIWPLVTRHFCLLRTHPLTRAYSFVLLSYPDSVESGQFQAASEDIHACSVHILACHLPLRERSGDRPLDPSTHRHLGNCRRRHQLRVLHVSSISS